MHRVTAATCLLMLGAGALGAGAQEGPPSTALFEDLVPGQVRHLEVRLTSGASLRLRCRFEADVAAVMSGAPLRSVRRDPGPEVLELDAERLVRIRWLLVQEGAEPVGRRRLSFELAGGRDGGRTLTWTSPPNALAPSGGPRPEARGGGQEVWTSRWKVEYRPPGAPPPANGETEDFVICALEDGTYMNVQLGARAELELDLPLEAGTTATISPLPGRPSPRGSGQGEPR